jgi:hypothetical protein
MPSSVINHYHYDNEAKTLTIVFVTGMVYRYLNVPEKTFKMFKGALSKGKYFNYHVKDKFDFEKIDE